MVSSCCVVGCANRRVTSRTTMHKRIRFYRFPKSNKERKIKWMKAVGRDDWEPSHFSRVCSDHFVYGEKSDNKLSPNYVPCLFQHTTPAERRRLHKLYDAFSTQLSERIEKINAATVMLSIVEQELVSSRENLHQGDDDDQCESESDSMDEGTDSESEALFVDAESLSSKKDETHSEGREIEFTQEMEEFLMIYSKKLSAGTKVEQGSQTTMACDHIKSLEVECGNLRSELVYLKGKYVFKNIRLGVFLDADDRVKYLTGLESYDMLKILNDSVSCYQKTMFKLTGFQQLLMTLIKMKLDLSVPFLGIMFDIDSSTVWQLFIFTINLLFSKLVPRLIIWPETKDPLEFEDCGNCVYVVDCFELQLQAANAPPVYESVENDYSGGSAVNKALIIRRYFLTIAPQGTIIFISKGRHGDVAIKTVALESGFFENVAPGDLIVIERELDIDDEVDYRGASVKMSSSVKSRMLSETNEEGSRGLVRIKWMVHLMKQKYQILGGKIPSDWVSDAEKGNFTTLDKIVHVSCALCNMTNKVWTSEKLMTPAT